MTKRIGLFLALILVLCLWFVYTVLQTLLVLGRLGDPSYSVLCFLPGIAAVGVLLKAGLSPGECFLRFAPLSRMGLVVLAAVFAFSLLAVLPFGEWTG